MAPLDGRAKGSHDQPQPPLVTASSKAIVLQLASGRGRAATLGRGSLAHRRIGTPWPWQRWKSGDHRRIRVSWPGQGRKSGDHRRIGIPRPGQRRKSGDHWRIGIPWPWKRREPRHHREVLVSRLRKRLNGRGLARAWLRKRPIYCFGRQSASERNS